jgi:cytochrome c biogenesis protein ResB
MIVVSGGDLLIQIILNRQYRNQRQLFIKRFEVLNTALADIVEVINEVYSIWMLCKIFFCLVCSLSLCGVPGASANDRAIVPKYFILVLITNI